MYPFESKMRGKGCKGGSSYRGSSDSLHSIARDAPAQVTSAPNVLSRPLPPSVANTCAGSSSSSASTPCASGGVTPNGEPTMHARDTPTSSMDCLPLTIDESRRPRIKLVNGMLHPSDVCARKITFIFKERMDENGYSWKNVSKETKDFYWNEFQKFFVWDESMLSAIKMAWQRKAAERYRALMCSLRKGKEKSLHVSDSAWKTWTDAWNSPEFKTRCETATANRLTEITGPGSGISRHTGGSISHASHADRLRSRLGRDPRPFELFEVTHTKKGTSMLVDTRAQSVKDRYLELVEQASQTQEGLDELPIVDETALYYDAVGGGKKSRVYG
ncbi:uncharacterized protein LOC120277413 isoform X2 [Dioscorea cayenensis subsp. rotundata]|uniref:Uncharacterized protein LOC120277413 isoform X2 n=1 Tax=Dioscorea cayennensis subsp. rotundata TaxID=55577 RepID=A0AB40CNM8_DIOCR|nr:uncharacterized protein LOC120277413 isoform X2 [Dioscorea cayenensis subsp. rotundata]